MDAAVGGYQSALSCMAEEDQEELLSLPSSEDDEDQDDMWMDAVIASVPPWASVRKHHTPIAERLLHSVLELRPKLAKVIATD